jgi:hypothetical protein|tara:strand:- start:184 stop:378 length:195 start_codon:yes stop_codon:yes gene_type:complete
LASKLRERKLTARGRLAYAGGGGGGGGSGGGDGDSGGDDGVSLLSARLCALEKGRSYQTMSLAS